MKKIKNIKTRIADENDKSVLEELDKICLERYGYEYNSVHVQYLQQRLVKSIYESK